MGSISAVLHSCGEPTIDSDINVNIIGEKAKSLEPEFLAQGTYLQEAIKDLKESFKNPHLDDNLKSENKELLKKLRRFEERAEALYKRGSNSAILNDNIECQLFAEDLDIFFAEATGLHEYSVKHLGKLAEKNTEALRLVSENSNLKKVIAEKDERFADNDSQWRNRYNGLNGRHTALQNDFNAMEDRLALSEAEREKHGESLAVKESELTHQKSLYTSLKNKNGELKDLLKIEKEATMTEQQKKCDVIFDLLDIARTMKDRAEMTFGRKNRKKLDVIRTLRQILQDQNYQNDCGYETDDLRQEFPKYYKVIKLGKSNNFN